MFIIGICGPSGSGKTTLAKKLAKKLNATVLSLDNYFLMSPKISKYKSVEMDLEIPRNIDWKKINEVIDELAEKGVAVGQKVDWKKMQNLPCKLKAKDVFIVEGFHTLYKKSLRERIDLSVYIDVSDKIGLHRRMGRDKSEKHRERYELATFPEYKKHRKKYEKRADIVLNGNLPVQILLKRIISKI